MIAVKTICLHDTAVKYSLLFAGKVCQNLPFDHASATVKQERGNINHHCQLTLGTVKPSRKNL